MTTQDHNQDVRLVEALLFASSMPLASEAIAAHLPEGVEIDPIIDELEKLYAGRGVNLVHVGGGWTFRTAPDLGPRLSFEKLVSRKLSRAGIETLAIIAYHQPVTRGEIEEIRGVALSKGTLDTLMEAGWIRPRGRRQTPGRPATWVTTPEFLTQFGLGDLDDLPGMEELKAAGLLDTRPGVAISDNAMAEMEEEEAEDEAEELLDEGEA